MSLIIRTVKIASNHGYPISYILNSDKNIENCNIMHFILIVRISDVLTKYFLHYLTKIYSKLSVLNLCDVSFCLD